jgi:phthiocerol/phthiodiolone dimycocerosyl transferase-like enzyme
MAPEGRPLDGFERQFWMVRQLAPMNVVAVAHLASSVDPAAARRVLDALQAKHAMLRARIAVGPDGPRFEVDGAEPLSLRVVTGDAEAWQREAEAELNAPFSDEGPLVRAVLVRQMDGSDVGLVFDHVIGDAMASFELLRAFARGLRDPATLAGPPLPLPPALTSLLPDDIVRETPAFAARAGQGMRTLLASGALRTLPREHDAPVGERRSRILHATLDEAATTALADRARKERTSVHGALCAALLRAVQSELDAPCMLGVTSPINVRGQLARPPGEDFGFYVAPMPTFHQVARERPFWELAREVKAQVQAIVMERRSLRMLALVEGTVPRDASLAARAAQQSDRLGLVAATATNLGRLDAPELKGFHFAAGINSHGPTVLVAATTVHGRLALNLVHPEPLIGRARAERILGGLQADLREAARS